MAAGEKTIKNKKKDLILCRELISGKPFHKRFFGIAVSKTLGKLMYDARKAIHEFVAKKLGSISHIEISGIRFIEDLGRYEYSVGFFISGRAWRVEKMMHGLGSGKQYNPQKWISGRRRR